MTHPLDLPLAGVAEALRRRTVSGSELVEEALARHGRRARRLHAYKHLAPASARRASRRADAVLARADDPPPLCGIPVSVKDIYGVQGLPTYAGTARRLPDAWERDGWLVGRLREQGAVLMGKTHTVELAFGGVGINPNWETPRNPWDAATHRIPGGSSSGAGVSLHEGSALVALGSDTGGSVRIPASMTGMVGHKTTKGRWPTDGVVPLSRTLDTLGALTRSVEDAAFFFGAVDPRHGNPAGFLQELRERKAPPRVGVPSCRIWGECQTDIAAVLHGALDELARAGWSVVEVEGRLVDEGHDLYMGSGIAATECRAFLSSELPGWRDILHPVVGRRIEDGARGPEEHARALGRHRRKVAEARALFDDVDVLVLPTAVATPPPVDDLDDLDRYLAANATALRPTCPVNILGLCALTLPIGLDRIGMPVGLQLVAVGGRDEALLAAGLAAERVLGTALDRLGRAPGVPR